MCVSDIKTRLRLLVSVMAGESQGESCFFRRRKREKREPNAKKEMRKKNSLTPDQLLFASRNKRKSKEMFKAETQLIGFNIFSLLISSEFWSEVWKVSKGGQQKKRYNRLDKKA